MRDSDYEERLERLPLPELQQQRSLQRRLYEQTREIDDMARISKYGWGGFAAIVGLIAVGGGYAVEEVPVIAMAGGISAGSHYVRKWNSQRLLRHEFDLRTTERVIDRRLGINPELSQ